MVRRIFWRSLAKSRGRCMAPAVGEVPPPWVATPFRPPGASDTLCRPPKEGARWPTAGVVAHKAAAMACAVLTGILAEPSRLITGAGDMHPAGASEPGPKESDCGSDAGPFNTCGCKENEDSDGATDCDVEFTGERVTNLGFRTQPWGLRRST